MVDFHKGLRGFERLRSSSGKSAKKKKKDISISKNKEMEELSLAKGKGSIESGESLYKEMLDFTRDSMDKVASGKSDKISANTFKKNADKFCSFLETLESPEELVWLVTRSDEYEENYLYTHSVNVCLILLYIAHKLNFPHEKMCTLSMAGIFHDIGMMKVPEEIWNNDGSMSPEEYEQVKKHPLYGEGILVGLNGVDEAVPLIIAQHHEKMDGSGYPGGLSKDQIHHLARFLSIVDRYEASTHTRLWRKKVLPDKALQRILDNESHLFDPYYLKALLKHISVFPVGSWVRISSGEVGIVLNTNENMPMRPVVKVLYNSEGGELAEEKVLDLSKQLLVHAEHCVDPDEIVT